MLSLRSAALLLPLLAVSLLAHAQDEIPRRQNYRDGGVLLQQTVDSMVLHKAKRRLEVYAGGKLLKYYPVSLGIEPAGRKVMEGDLRTPEGLYRVNDRNAFSSYHKNLGINYPSFFDSVYARILGQSAGGEIKIHGFPNKHRKDQEQELLNSDWTLGCIAVADWEIDELYTWVSFMCPILILP